ncbi:MAG: hypothetical protein QOE36_3046 [Gaiellaceae bacterium]|nr:hypothetical protein [Gaiellaceae bacterium]
MLKKKPPSKQLIVVAGASSGLGWAVATRLALRSPKGLALLGLASAAAKAGSTAVRRR